MRQGLIRWTQVAAVVQFCCWSVVFSSFFNEIIDAVDYEDISATNSFDVRLIHVEEHGHVIADNGICRVTITIPDGTIVGIKYGGIDNLLYENTDGHGYWDAGWERPGQKSSYTKLNGVTYSVIKETGDQVELSFRYRSNPRNPHSLPFKCSAGQAGFFTRLGRLIKQKAKSDVDKLFSGFTKTRDNLVVIDELLLYWNLADTDRVLELKEARITFKIVDSLREVYHMHSNIVHRSLFLSLK